MSARNATLSSGSPLESTTGNWIQCDPNYFWLNFKWFDFLKIVETIKKSEGKFVVTKCEIGGNFGMSLS